jgi:hypothetical protein
MLVYTILVHYIAGTKIEMYVMCRSYNATRYGLSKISVQCRFVKVRGDSNAVCKLFMTNLSDFNASDTDSSIIMVAKGDFITLNTDKVYPLVV